MLNSGCGSYPSIAPRQSTIDPEFIPFVEKFEKEQNEVVDIDIMFKATEGQIVALCWRYDYNKQGISIEVDPNFWFSSTEMEKEETIYHELGHCILARDHTEELIDYKVPKSIMYPYVFSLAYEKYRSYYVDELKNQKVLLTDYLE